MKKTVTFTACFRELGVLSGSWLIDFPQAISASHDIWKFIQQDQYDDVVLALRSRKIMANNIADDDGTSLLLVSIGSLENREWAAS